MATQNSVNVGLSAAQGSVNFAGTTSPTFITPTLGAAIATSIQIGNAGIIDTNAKVALALSATASAVNGFTITNAATLGSPLLAATGTDSNIGFNLKVKGTGQFQFTDGNGNILLTTTTVASAVNYLSIENNATLNNPVILAQGTDSNIGIQLGCKGTGSVLMYTPGLANYVTVTPAATGSAPVIAIAGDANRNLNITGIGTGGVALKGQTGATAVAAGYVGELLESANATAVAMTTATVTQIQTLSLTAGDWDVWATFYTTVGGTTVSSAITCQLHTTTATIAAPTTAQLSSIQSAPGTEITGQTTYLSTGQSRWNVNGATTVYLNAQATYSVSTLTGNGMIHARRVD